MTMPCPRQESWMLERFKIPKSEWRMNGTCSFCGSMKAEMFFEAIRKGATLTPTDKNYKVYVRGEGSPASDGSPPHVDKFYFYHLSEDEMRDFVEMYNNNEITFGYPGHFYVAPFFMGFGDKDD